MREIIHTSECRELADLIWRIAKSAKVEDAHWIATPDGEYLSNNGNEWCFDCGSAKVKHLRKHDRKRAAEYILDGGWVSEHDCPIRCAHCGVRLRCSMLSTGAAEELDYFSKNPPRPGNPDDAYDFHEVLTALEYSNADDAELVAEAVEIGRKLVAAMEEPA